MITITLPTYKIHTGSLILVNPRYGFTDRETAKPVPVLEKFCSVRLQRRAVTLLSNLMEEIHGWQRIVPVSGWRSLREQQAIWDDTLKEKGIDFTQKYVAVPGHSEHQTGLAIDLGLKQDRIDFIRPEFPYEGICQTFREKAADYGFIERYPAGKEGITGIGHEPWHFRYVGIPHASVMKKHNLTLEEYILFLSHFPHGREPYLIRAGRQDVMVSYLKASAEGETVLEVSASSPYCISGNNVDGFIITEWR